MLKRILIALGLAAAMVVVPLSVSPASADETVPETVGTVVVQHNFGVVAVSGTWTTLGGTAVAGQDYTAVSGTFSGSGIQPAFVPILDDAVHEGTETFRVRFTISPLQQFDEIITINDDDAAPIVSIDDVSQSEGSSPATFTVTLTGATALVTTVNYTTTDGSAIAGSDYTATTGTLTFPPGALTQTIPVPITADLINEPVEQYVVDLAGAVNATIADGQGVGTILDDDTPLLTIDDLSVAEGSGVAAFTVSLAPASYAPVTVTFATADGTATAGADYVSSTGTLTFAPGVVTQTVSIAVLDDDFDEADETVLLDLSNSSGAMIVDSQGVATIADDDVSASRLGLTGSTPLPWLTLGWMLVLAGVALVGVASRRRHLATSHRAPGVRVQDG